MGACSSGDDGGDAADDTVGATTPTSTTPADEPSLTSTAFAEGEEIPVEHGGCPPGENVAPPLEWTGLPADAEQLAVTVVDPDAGDFVHWAMAGLDPATTSLDADEVPAGTVEALNDGGQAGYFGPCPPEVHTYEFTVHALSGDPGLSPDQSGGDAVAAIEAVTTASATLSGRFTP
jgi:Raf kinase inhibitor-like YbhB/YbcL family protein